MERNKRKFLKHIILVSLIIFVSNGISRSQVENSQASAKTKVSVYTCSRGYLWDGPGHNKGKPVKEIESWTKVEVISYYPIEKIFKIMVNGEEGYFLSSNLQQTPELIAMRDKANLEAKPELDRIENEKQKKEAAEKQEEISAAQKQIRAAQEEKNKKQALAKKLAAEKQLAIEKEFKDRSEAMKKKYGEQIGSRIIHRDVWIGMTAEMARDSMGGPVKTTKTVTAGHVQEVWIYPSLILHFDNGILNVYQE